MVIVSHLTRLEIGRLAVLMFFLLSGYWVHRIWIAKFGWRRIGRFYASRYLRIMPLYLITILAASALMAFPLTPTNLGLLGVATTKSGIGPAWSLDIELQFYLLFPLLLALAGYLPRAASLLGLVGATLVGWILYERFRIVTLAVYLPAFAAGIVISATNFDPGRRAAAISLAAFALTSAAILCLPMTRLLVVDPPRVDPAEALSFFWMLPLTPYIAHSLARGSGPLDRHLGNLSFPLYLAHVPVIALMEQHFGHGLVVKGLAVALALAVALGLYVFVDRPIDAARVRLLERRAPAPSPAG